MSELCDKRQALKILQERTGKKYGPGIFARSFRSDRIHAFGNCTSMSEIEAFLQRREERAKETPDAKLHRRVRRVMLNACGLALSLGNLLKRASLPSGVRRPLVNSRMYANWSVSYLFEAERELAQPKQSQIANQKTEMPESPVPNPEDRS